MTFLLPILALVGCGQPPAETAAPAPDDHGDHDHAAAAPHDHAAAAPHDHAAMDHGGPDHAGAHAAGGGHMADMVATREKLRITLGAAYDAPVPGLDTADAAAGKVVYDQACASCHGATGKGDGAAGAGLTPPPADFTDAFHARFYADAARVHIVREGIEGTAMAGFEATLSEKDLLDVYAHVKSLRPAAGTAAPAADHAHH